jgi:hypothetical protein
MIKVTPYILTIGSEKFKTFLAQPFTTDLLYPISGDGSIETFFSGWRGKDMVNWHKFTNEEKIILEFYPNNHYIIKKTNGTYQIPLPKTLNDFINDMDRFGVQLYWNENIDKQFEPKEYLHKDEIRAYFVTLLTKMCKSHELL